MAERKLPNKRRKFSKGKAIRVSDLIYNKLNVKRGERSWDAFMRWLFGMPDRAGNVQPLVEGMLEVHSGMLLIKLPDTRWNETEDTARKLAEKMAAKRKVSLSLPIRMREVR